MANRAEASVARALLLPPALLGAGALVLLAATLLALLAGPLGDVRIPEFVAWHALMEIGSIAISFLIAVAAWFHADGRRSLGPLSAGFAAVSVLDTAHLLSFPGMPDWLGAHSVDQTLCFWFAARWALALVFVLLLLPSSWQRRLVLLYPLWLAGALLLGLGWPERLPPLYVSGLGLTPLKIALEWAVCVAYLVLAVIVYRRPGPLRGDLLGAGLVVLGAGELFFTVYTVPDGLGNGVGHVYKLAGMAFFLRAVVEAQIVVPYRELQQSELARDRVATRLVDMIRGAPDGIVIVAQCGSVRSANPMAEAMFGAPSGGLEGLKIEQLVPEPLRHRHAAERERYRQNPDVRSMSAKPALQAQRLDGSRFYVDVSLSPVEWDGELTTVAFVRDASTRVEQMLRLDWLAAHDSLTGLPNRWAITRELAARCGAGARGQCVMLDVDNLGRVNDALGHDTGDALLKAMAQRMSRQLKEGDFLGRLEGDKFVLFCNDRHCSPNALVKLLDQLNRPLQLDDGLLLEVSVTAGVAHFPADGRDAEALIQASEIAMVEAKRTQRRGVGSYDPQLHQRGKRWISLSSRLPQALQRGEFRLVFQPRVRLDDRRLSGVEALLRWDSPDGAIGPGEFIPVAEENGFILELGRWSIGEALRQMRDWKEAGVQPGQLGINLSTRQLADGDLPRYLRHAMQQHRIDPAEVKLEVTETAAMENLDWALPRLKALAAEGVSMALDDFGTGYSSLAYLQRLPIGVIKIDIAFVQGIGDPSGEALLRSIIGLAQGLGKHLVAEGVETPAQAEWLREAGCDEGQGYLYSRPLPPEQLPAFIDSLSSHPPPVRPAQ